MNYLAPYILIVIEQNRKTACVIIIRGRCYIYVFSASSMISMRTVALINVHLRKEKKIVRFRETVTAQIAIVCRGI